MRRHDTVCKQHQLNASTNTLATQRQQQRRAGARVRTRTSLMTPPNRNLARTHAANHRKRHNARENDRRRVINNVCEATGASTAATLDNETRADVYRSVLATKSNIARPAPNLHVNANLLEVNSCCCESCQTKNYKHCVFVDLDARFQGRAPPWRSNCSLHARRASGEEVINSRLMVRHTTRKISSRSRSVYHTIDTHTHARTRCTHVLSLVSHQHPPHLRAESIGQRGRGWSGARPWRHASRWSAVVDGVRVGGGVGDDRRYCCRRRRQVWHARVDGTTARKCRTSSRSVGVVVGGVTESRLRTRTQRRHGRQSTPCISLTTHHQTHHLPHFFAVLAVAEAALTSTPLASSSLRLAAASRRSSSAARSARTASRRRRRSADSASSLPTAARSCLAVIACKSDVHVRVYVS
jgi:hypothetical protein